MTIQKLSVYFSHSNFDDDQLVNRTHFIVDCMDRNPLFPDSAPYLQELIKTREAFRREIMRAQGGTMQEKSEKNKARLVVVSVLEKLEQHLQNVSNGDTDFILRSGLYGPQKNLPPQKLKNTDWNFF